MVGFVSFVGSARSQETSGRPAQNVDTGSGATNDTNAANNPVIRYIARHGQKRVAKVVLIFAVPPLMLKTEKNPGGLPLSVFDDIRAGIAHDHSQFYKELTLPFYGYNKPGAQISEGVRESFWLQGLQSSIHWIVRRGGGGGEFDDRPTASGCNPRLLAQVASVASPETGGIGDGNDGRARRKSTRSQHADAELRLGCHARRASPLYPFGKLDSIV